MQEALDDGVAGDGPDKAFWVRMEERRNDWALVMLCAGHALKGARDNGWRSFTATASAILDGRTLATVPILGYMFSETVKAWLEEQYGRLSEGDDGTVELVRLIAAAAWPEGGVLLEDNSA